MAQIEMRLDELISLIDELTTEDDCRFDHLGNCQVHLWFHETPCPQKRAKELLKAIGNNEFTLDINL